MTIRTTNLSIALFTLASLSAQRPGAVAAPDPSSAEVPLPSAPGWDARLVFDAGVGVWTVISAQVHSQFGCPEIVALDDKGRCTVLRSYSGKWTPEPTIQDGQWLAPIGCGDLDPTLQGVELYTGGQGGRLWQIRPRPSSNFDCRVIGEWPGQEIHTVVVDDLDPTHDGVELLAFLASGKVCAIAATSGPTRGLEVRDVAQLSGRVREAVVLPPKDGEAPWLASVSRAGEVALLRLRGQELEQRILAREPMGLGRICLAPAVDARTVLYVTRDDGLILRFAGRPDTEFAREVVYAGPQGPRGITTGRFHEDPRRECLAIFGYSKKVELLSRLPGKPWQAEVIFTDIDQGHWLATAELDGRNGTDELIGSGYSGHVFLLSRPPGYGLRDADAAVLSSNEATAAGAPFRLGLRASAGGAEKLTPLRYTGGFEPKTMIYETLVRRGDDGRLAPGLAASWSFEDEGRSVRFVLRPGARFHDGTPVTAAAVRQHFRRWVGLPEHDWLSSNQRIVDVAVETESVVRVVMDRPWALLPDLCAINPCAIVGPGARDREGEFVQPVGTGPFRFVGQLDGSIRWRVEEVANTGSGPLSIDVMTFARNDGDDPLDALQRGEIDVFVGGWDEDLSTDSLRELRSTPTIKVVEAPGTAVVSLHFRLRDGPTADRSVRSRIADAISRADIIRGVEDGRADPCTTWAAPAVTFWPGVSRPAVEDAGADHLAPAKDESRVSLRIATLGSRRGARVAAVVSEQLDRAGFRTEIVERDGDVDVSLSHGVPYDPHISLVSRFGPSGRARDAAPAALRELVDQAAATPDEAQRIPIYARIQDLIDREVLMVPLYAPRRIALHTADVEGIRLGIDVYRVDLSGLRRK